MKKMFFTAIAVVAFVGTSMAKTGEVEVKKFNVRSNNKIEKNVLLAPSDACDDVWRALYIHFLGNGSSAAAATAATKKADLHAAIAGC
jgi:hypothetical protein